MGGYVRCGRVRERGAVRKRQPLMPRRAKRSQAERCSERSEEDESGVGLSCPPRTESTTSSAGLNVRLKRSAAVAQNCCKSSAIRWSALSRFPIRRTAAL